MPPRSTDSIRRSSGNEKREIEPPAVQGKPLCRFALGDQVGERLSRFLEVLLEAADTLAHFLGPGAALVQLRLRWSEKKYQGIVCA